MLVYISIHHTHFTNCSPTGALLGWAILKDVFGPAVFGVAFGLIAGMMVFISLKELLPMAYMFIIALSLILFLY